MDWMFLPGHIPLTDENRLHILRHFRKVSEGYLQSLAGSLELPLEEVKQQLDISGSKFDISFAEDPDNLWDLFRLKMDGGIGITEEFFDDGRSHISFSFDRARNPGGVGTDGLLPLKDIPPAYSSLVKRVPRGGEGFYVLTITASSVIRPTWDVHVITSETGGDQRILTIFPGIYAPPLPDPGKHTPAELEQFSRFWRNYVFIEEQSFDSVSVDESG